MFCYAILCVLADLQSSLWERESRLLYFNWHPNVCDFSSRCVVWSVVGVCGISWSYLHQLILFSSFLVLRRFCLYLRTTLSLVCNSLNVLILSFLYNHFKSRWIWQGNGPILQHRPTHSTAAKRYRAQTYKRQIEHNESKETSHLFLSNNQKWHEGLHWK